MPEQGLVHDPEKTGGREVDIENHEERHEVHDALLKAPGSGERQDFLFDLDAVADHFAGAAQNSGEIAAGLSRDAEHPGKGLDIVEAAALCEVIDRLFRRNVHPDLPQ